MFKPGSYSPIGLEINSWEFRALQLRGGPDSCVVHRSAVLPRSSQPSESPAIDHEECAELAEMLARNGFRGNRVAITAPGAACSSQILKLPDRASGAPIETIARAEVARSSREVGGFALAAWYLPDRGRGEQGLAVACEQEALDGRLDALETGGLRPVAVDLEEAALQRACHNPQNEQSESTIDAILQVGWDVSLGVLTLDGSVVYTRRIGFGVADMVLRLADRSGLVPCDAGRLLSVDADGPGVLSGMANWSVQGWNRLARALAGEIDTAVTYVSHAYRRAGIGGVVLTGFGNQRPELCETLDHTLGMPVRAFGSDGSHPALAEMRPAPRGRLAVAFGLARRFDQ